MIGKPRIDPISIAAGLRDGQSIESLVANFKTEDAAKISRTAILDRAALRTKAQQQQVASQTLVENLGKLIEEISVGFLALQKHIQGQAYSGSGLARLHNAIERDRPHFQI